MDGVRILQIIIILAIIGVINYLLRLYRTLKLEKRISNFAISSNQDIELSLFDKLTQYINNIIKKISKSISKSSFLTSYSENYQKYQSNPNSKNAIDYISIKILLSIIMLIIYLFAIIIGYQHFNILILIIIFLIGFYIPDIYLKINYSKKRKRIEEDLLKAIIIMNSAFESGRNIMQAVEVVKNELDGPIKDEFAKIYLDITYGLSIDMVFNRFYERVKLEEVKYITSSLTLLNKTGGDIIKVFSVIEKSIYERKNLKNELHSLTASSRFVFKLLVALPPIFTFLIYILNPSYFAPLVTNTLGIIILIFIILLYIIYIFIIKKVLEVKI